MVTKLSTVLYAAVFMVGLPSCRDSKEFGSLPRDWYTLPEDRQDDSSIMGLANEVEPAAAAIPEEENTLEAAKTLDVILESNQIVLERVPKKGKWPLTQLQTILGIGTKGTVGVAMLKGTSVTNFDWRRVETKQPVFKEKEAMEEGLNTIVIESGMKREDIMRSMEPAIRSAEASGRIRDVPAFRTNLEKAADVFVELASNLDESTTTYKWWVSGLRLDLSVSASGNVLPWMTAGGDVRFRFYFNRIQPKAGVVSKPVEKNVASNSDLKTFISGMVKDLSSTSEKALVNTGFKPDYLEVGLGFGANGTIYVVKAGVESAFVMLFKRGKVPLSVKREAFAEEDSGFMKVGNVKSDKEIEFAHKHDITYETTTDDGRGLFQPVDRVIYKVDRKKFRKGLEKAYKMSKFFIDGANRRPKKHWEIFRIENNVDFSVSGSVGLASLTGFATARLDFAKE